MGKCVPEFEFEDSKEVQFCCDYCTAEGVIFVGGDFDGWDVWVED